MAFFETREKCPVCGSAQHRTILSVPYSDPKVHDFLVGYYEGRISDDLLAGEDYTVAKCAVCGLLFQTSILDEKGMELLYDQWIPSQASLDKKMKSSVGLFEEYAIEVAGISRLFGRQPADIKVLEFGMGWGFWSTMAMAFNYNSEGAELSRSRVEFARSRGVKVIGDVFESGVDRYDYIYSNQVFEHLSDPFGVLKRLSELLHVNGLIRIKVPSSFGMESHLRSSAWKATHDALHPLEHINCFDRSSLKKMARLCGLVPVRSEFRLEGFGGVSIVRNALRWLYNGTMSTDMIFRKVGASRDE